MVATRFRFFILEFHLIVISESWLSDLVLKSYTICLTCTLLLLLIFQFDHLVPHYIDHLLCIGYNDLLLRPENSALSLNHSDTTLSLIVLLIEIWLVQVIIHKEAIINNPQNEFLSVLFLTKIGQVFVIWEQIMHGLCILWVVDRVRVVLKG